MRIPIKALCEGKRKRNDGKALIYLQYFYDGEHRVFLNTQLAIPPEFWDRKRQCVKENMPAIFGHPSSINKEVSRQLRLATDLAVYAKDQAIVDIGPFIKEKFSPEFDLQELIRQRTQADSPFIPRARKQKEGFFLHLDDYVNSKRKKVKPATITVYNNMIHHFEAFERYRKTPITFVSIDFQFYEDFVDFLTYEYELPRKKKTVKGLRINSIGKTIHQFRIFVRDRVKRKIIPPIDLTYRNTLNSCQLETFLFLAASPACVFLTSRPSSPKTYNRTCFIKSKKSPCVGSSFLCAKRQKKYSLSNLKQTSKKSAMPNSIRT